MFSKRLLANTRGENGEETTKDPRNPFTPCAFAAWAASKPISSSKPISRHHRKQRKTGLPRTAFRADSNALITPQNMKNMKLDVNSYADHACGARRAPETTPNPAQPLARSPRSPARHHDCSCRQRLASCTLMPSRKDGSAAHRVARACLTPVIDADCKRSESEKQLVECSPRTQ